jgi:hypothetical protein
MTVSSELDKQITDQGVKMKVLEYAANYIKDRSHLQPIVASSLGIAEPSFVVQLGEFNKLTVQRTTLLKTTTAANPVIQSLDVQIEKIRQSMIESLENVRQAYSLTLGQLELKRDQTNAEISSIPGKEKELLDIRTP